MPISRFLGTIFDLLFAPVTGRGELSEEMRAERHDEIGSWLRERLSVEEAVGRMKESDEALGISQSSDEFNGWIDKSLQAGDELWYYDTGGDSWYSLCGEDGFAIVRGGKVVDFYMWWMN